MVINIRPGLITGAIYALYCLSKVHILPEGCVCETGICMYKHALITGSFVPQENNSYSDLVTIPGVCFGVDRR